LARRLLVSYTFFSVFFEARPPPPSAPRGTFFSLEKMMLCKFFPLQPPPHTHIVFCFFFFPKDFYPSSPPPSFPTTFLDGPLPRFCFPLGLSNNSLGQLPAPPCFLYLFSSSHQNRKTTLQGPHLFRSVPPTQFGSSSPLRRAPADPRQKPDTDPSNWFFFSAQGPVVDTNPVGSPLFSLGNLPSFS